MSGGIKFFEMSWADINRSAVVTTISNNTAQKDYINNRDQFYDYTSSGANSDSTTVTYTIDFGVSRTCDRLFLKDTNIKNFSLEKWNGSTWDNVFTETGLAASYYYKEFTSFSASQVRLKMNTTQTAHQEKTLGEFVITQEIGQLVGFPKIDLNPDKNTVSKKMLTGKKKTVYTGLASAIKLTFENYVGAADRALFKTLFAKYGPFMVWLCANDTTMFEYTDFGYAADEWFLVTIPDGYSHSFYKNLYKSGMNATLVLEEAA